MFLLLMAKDSHEKSSYFLESLPKRSIFYCESKLARVDEMKEVNCL